MTEGSESLLSSNESLELTLDSDLTLEARFHPEHVTVTIGDPVPPEGGTSDPSPGTYEVDYGSDFTASASASEHYEFSGWATSNTNFYGTLVSTSNPYTFTATEDVTLYPWFEPGGTDGWDGLPGTVYAEAAEPCVDVWITSSGAMLDYGSASGGPAVGFYSASSGTVEVIVEGAGWVSQGAAYVSADAEIVEVSFDEWSGQTQGWSGW